jgi:ABC-type transporter MlaC component
MTRISPAIGALILLIGLCTALPREADAQDARAFVANLGNQAIQVLGPSVTPAQRVARFRQLFQNDFDVPGIGQFVLGRYWRTATPEEQQELRRGSANMAASRSRSSAAGPTATRPSSPARSTARIAAACWSTGI